MISKLLIFILISYFVIKFIYKRDKNRLKRRQNTEGIDSASASSPHQGAVQTLKECPVCATFFEENHGVKLNKTLYCSKTCANK